MRIRALFSIALTLMLFGCNAELQIPTTVGTALPSPNQYSTIAPIFATQNPGESDLEPGDVHLDSTPNDQITKNCIDKGDRIIDDPFDTTLPGIILFQEQPFRGLFARENQTGKIYTLLTASNTVITYGFTPDEQWFAYAPVQPQTQNGLILQTPSVVLWNISGEKITKNVDLSSLDALIKECCGDKQIRGLWVGEWVTNDLLYVELHFSDNQGGMVGVLPLILNPFTMEWQSQWFAALPNKYTSIFSRFKSHEVKLSPDTDRILYPLNGGGISLYDTKEEKVIWSDQDFDTGFSEIIDWSSNSQFVAVVNAPDFEKLAIISRDGFVESITNNELPVTTSFINVVKWSPDSNYLSLAGSGDQNRTDFILYDPNQKEFLLGCELLDQEKWIDTIVWAPNSQWVVISATDYSMTLIDIRRGEIINLTGSYTAVAWSKLLKIQNWLP